MINDPQFQKQKINYLHHYLEQAKNKSFKWGDYDCMIWVLNYMKDLLNEHYIMYALGSYETRTQAIKLIKKTGFKNLRDAFGTRFKEIDLKHVQRGDIVLLDNWTCGLCSGLNSFFLKDTKGMIGVKTIECAYGFSVY